MNGAGDGRRAGRPGGAPGAPCAGRGGPPPNRVRYNEWPRVAVPDAGAFTPTEGVTVVVPHFEAPGELALALAALERQRYPRGLLEVVVVDDGSRTPPRLAPSSLAVRLVRQEDRGFGLARARDTGARAARHDILVFLDGDVVADEGLVAAHARWHHAVADAVTVGFRAHVDPAGVDAAAIASAGCVAGLFGKAAEPPWTERHMARTDDLTSRHDDLFRALVGANFGIRRPFFAALGGFDVSFTGYGGEDLELGYRAYTAGGLLVPVRGGHGVAPRHLARRARGEDAGHGPAACEACEPDRARGLPGAAAGTDLGRAQVCGDGRGRG